ncbi:hypothetical protein [Mycolicibacterium arseniciresistens]|uniref:Uncharacterized protein n=1 Tax=Mycolicibacterium arseniciresistens TaxID=3062257 RepID=A0ABT8UT04_9MYCO|nr:hypothetical protein [Mycolicibacterium arseniciresistens]MDO3639538.1 hypothetical protein [Mycolicibacterium arseniciresistens]
MADDGRWLAYLYETHPPEQLRRWAPSLRYFRFCRAFGGHAGDGDSLRAAVRATTEAEVRTVLAGLGLDATPVADDAPRPVPGVGYRGDAYARLPRRIDHLPHLAQPGHVDIGGVRAFVWVRATRVEVSLHDRGEVTREVVDSALRIEPHLAPFAADVLDPPLDDPHCVCPKYHPHLWR